MGTSTKIRRPRFPPQPRRKSLATRPNQLPNPQRYRMTSSTRATTGTLEDRCLHPSGKTDSDRSIQQRSADLDDQSQRLSIHPADVRISQLSQFPNFNAAVSNPGPWTKILDAWQAYKSLKFGGSEVDGKKSTHQRKKMFDERHGDYMRIQGQIFGIIIHDGLRHDCQKRTPTSSPSSQQPRNPYTSQI